MSTIYKLKSHIFKDNPLKDDQLLADHLKGVRDIALNTSKMHGITGEIHEIIDTICMCHDFGKASSYFQRYLNGEYNEKLKNHGEISAYFTYYMLPEKWKLIGFMCVKKHHGNLEPEMDFFKSDNKEDIRKIALDIEKNIDELNSIYEKDISQFFTLIKEDSFLEEVLDEYKKRGKKYKKLKKKSNNENTKTGLEEFIWIQYLWSLLLTGDKTQLIRGEFYENKTNIKEDYTFNYKENVRQELTQKFEGIEDTLLFKVRNKIYEEAVESINKLDLNKEHILSINVPTGTGKTIAVYGAAFKLLERIIDESHGTIRPSIIYNIPFMSVIDQNYDVLSDILKESGINTYEDLILKHHSMSNIEYKDSEDKEYRNYDARFCVENWQSTIITTTFVQLFNTIFQSGINSIMHRFHKLAGSIIILDEVQAIPPKYYRIIEEIFNVLCEKFNTYVITVTATKPLFLEGRELITSSEDIFNSLNRITIENHTDKPITLGAFKDIVLEDIKENTDKSFLIVLNTVKASLEVLDYVKDSSRKVLYLSTEIHPARRLEVIKQVKESNEKYVVVSTQLIEAGVDLDFDIVYRDLSTMDSINQTAGRANRNAIKGKGIVKLYTLLNENHNDKKFSRYIYSEVLLDVTENILSHREIINENEIGSINKKYFEKVKQATLGKCSEDYEEIKSAIFTLNFKKIRELFKLIEDKYEKEDVIINYNEETQRCLDIIEDGKEENQVIINAWRTLNKYRVSVNKKDIYVDRLIDPYKVKGANVLNSEDYDKDRGIKRKSISFN